MKKLFLAVFSFVLLLGLSTSPLAVEAKKSKKQEPTDMETRFNQGEFKVITSTVITLNNDQPDDLPMQQNDADENEVRSLHEETLQFAKDQLFKNIEELSESNSPVTNNQTERSIAAKGKKKDSVELKVGLATDVAQKE